MRAKKPCVYCSRKIDVSCLSRHEKACHSNPAQKHKCPKCKKAIYGRAKFCGKSCAASFNLRGRKRTAASKRKTAKTLKGKLKTAREKRKCKTCNKSFTVKVTSVKKFCSKKCQCQDPSYRARLSAAVKKSHLTSPRGGYQRGGGRGHSGWYKGIFCDSTWELAYVIYCVEHNIQIARNKKAYEYELEGKKRKYSPDFIVDNEIVEIKGYVTEQWKAKLSQFKGPIKVLYGNEMQPIFDYVIAKYGKDFKTMYESRNPNFGVANEK